MYSYIGPPLRGLSWNSVHAPKIFSYSGVILMLVSLGRWPGRFQLVKTDKMFSAIGGER